MNVPNISERIDDIPVIISILQMMGVAQIINEVIPPHGNWIGLSIGDTSIIWIAHILSQGNHRLSHVQSWAKRRINSLRAILGKPVSAFDFTDDRLYIILEKLYNPEIWDEIESRLNENIIKVYNFSDKTVRLYCTTISSYGVVTKDGLIQFGCPKDNPNNPVIKVPIAVLDPLGLPICISTVPGNCADDPQYLPMIRKIQQTIPMKGLLYVGDCKMCAIETRTEIAATGDYYLCPLSEVSFSSKELRKKVSDIENLELVLTPVQREYANGEIKMIAYGYEESIQLSGLLNDTDITWIERRLFIKSINYAESQQNSLDNRLNKALDAINHLNLRGKGYKPPKTLREAEEKGEKILIDNRMQNFITIKFKDNVEEIPVNAYGNKPARIKKKITINCTSDINLNSFNEYCKTLGWRVYATNMPIEELSLEKVVLAYRDQFKIEDMFHRLKGKPLSLYPMFFHRDDHIDGLVKLLSIALRCLVCLEKTVHDSINDKGMSLTGIYEYNPKKKTKTPRAERILDIFNEITLTIADLEEGRVIFISDLSDKQREILDHLKIGYGIYYNIPEIVYLNEIITET